MTIIGGRAERGGGICNDDGMLSLTDGNIDHSSGRRFGERPVLQLTATLTGVIVPSKRARSGGLANVGTLSLTNVSMRGNTAPSSPAQLRAGARP